jgi:hypothetical protein
MINHIDIFYSPSDEQTPFCAFVWHDGAVVGTTSYRRLAQIADWCSEQNLPIFCASAELRAELRTYGIEAQSSTAALKKRTEAGIVQIRLMGKDIDLDVVWHALSMLELQGLHISIQPPRPARQSDGNGMLAFGTITIEPDYHPSDT